MENTQDPGSALQALVSAAMVRGRYFLVHMYMAYMLMALSMYGLDVSRAVCLCISVVLLWSEEWYVCMMVCIISSGRIDKYIHIHMLFACVYLLCCHSQRKVSARVYTCDGCNMPSGKVHMYNIPCAFLSVHSYHMSCLLCVHSHVCA